MPKVKIADFSVADNQFVLETSEGKQVWTVSRLIKLAEGLEAFDLPLIHIDLTGCYWRIASTRGFLFQMKRVQKADLIYPIILNYESMIMDGWHRICKAILEERETIKAVRFDYYVEPDYIEKTRV